MGERDGEGEEWDEEGVGREREGWDEEGVGRERVGRGGGWRVEEEEMDV